MELLAVGLWGYRRFEKDEGDLDVAGSPVAVVGPNEVGKTSFLWALQHLNHEENFEPGELTRGGKGKACVRAVFGLDDQDRAAIAGAGGVGRPTIFNVWKREGGGLQSSLEPSVERDLAPREKVIAAVRRLLATKWAKGVVDDPLVERVTKLHDDLVGDEQTLDEELVQDLRNVAGELRKADGVPASAKTLVDQLTALAKHEAAEHPDAAAREILMRRRPRFLWFEDDRRQLDTTYNILGAATPALRNLLAMVDLDWGALQRAVQARDGTTVAELIDAANRRFETIFAERWRQANVQVHLDRNAEELNIYVTNRRRRFVPIAERSAGLRHFIALLAFVEREAAGKDAIVLVDEAEQHLHYDAQADLMRVFTEQTVAKKIMYSTHSAGCLPHDLGMGVRVLEPVGPEDVDPDDWDRSRVRNWFWSESVPGFSPLLMAMGASTFAFAGTRKALVTEGISDVLLLPTLLREATGETTLEFQVAPGLAHINKKTAAVLDLVASRVVYVVDGDEAGLAKRDELIEAGVPEGWILVLGDGEEELTLEDLLVKELYVGAVNQELAFRQRPTIDSNDVADRRRKHSIDEWADEHLGENGRKCAPSERAVAHHLLEQLRAARLRGEELTLLDPSRRGLVRLLHDRVVELLKQPAYSLRRDEAEQAESSE